jgi:uncharacterized protein involved in copper resistance
MKHHIRTLACGAVLFAALAVIACGGRQTTASKSAAAYDEAKQKGIPIAAGEHGGHSAEAAAEPAAAATPTATNHAAMPGMDHSTMAGTDHAKMPGMQHGASGSGGHTMDHSAMAGMDHSKMPGMQHGASNSGGHTMDHSAMAGMDHSRMPGMQQGAPGSGAGKDHSAMAGMDHSKMPAMQHGAPAAGSQGMAGMDHSAMPGMSHGIQHGSPVAAPLVIAPPTSNAAIAAIQPAATLRADEFDAPAPAAIEEAAKGASGMSHSMEQATPKAPAPPQHDHKPPQPQPPAQHPDHGGGEAS